MPDNNANERRQFQTPINLATYNKYFQNTPGYMKTMPYHNDIDRWYTFFGENGTEAALTYLVLNHFKEFSHYTKDSIWSALRHIFEERHTHPDIKKFDTYVEHLVTAVRQLEKISNDHKMPSFEKDDSDNTHLTNVIGHVGDLRRARYAGGFSNHVGLKHQPHILKSVRGNIYGR